MKSLSLGFGEVSGEKDYRTWEFGTYRCAWRVVRNGEVLCGSQDPADLAELNTVLGGIELGRLASLEQVNGIDTRVDFDNGVSIDFLATFSDDDECFHIFGAGHLAIVFSIRDGWKVGPSNKPWPPEIETT